MTEPATETSPLTGRSHLRAVDIGPLALAGLRNRATRSLLSAGGVALGVATLVAVLGISNSSRAQLIGQIDALGTNLLTAAPGQTFGGSQVALPASAPGMVARIGPVLSEAAIYNVTAAIYRNRYIPSVNTEAITVYAADPALLVAVEAHLARGRFLDTATAHLPAVVLGSAAATALGIDETNVDEQVVVSGHLFVVVGILQPIALAPELDRSALVGLPIARELLGASGVVAEIYVRTEPTSVAAVQGVLADTADPAAPQDVAVADPTDALVARADASAALQSLFLALGGVALVVGGVGIANVMVISVLERRGEIGLRRALGATRRHVGAQFFAESVLLSSAGGVGGAIAGGFATTIYAAQRHWPSVVPASGLLAAIGVAICVGAFAGLYPALRATRLSPSEALRTT